MKKLLSLCLVSMIGFSALFGMAGPNPNARNNPDGTITIFAVDKDASVKPKQTVDKFKDVTTINGKAIKKRNPITFDLSAYADHEVYVEFSCDIKVVTKDNSPVDLMWMINELSGGTLPTLCQKKVESGVWTTMKGEMDISLGANKNLYLSGAGIDNAQTTFYLKNIEIKLSGESLSKPTQAAQTWMEADSIKAAYDGLIPHIGIACGWRGELQDFDIQDGLARHVNSITTGNEFKPDFIFNWASHSQMSPDLFVAENGKAIEVPMGMPNFGNMKGIINAVTDMKIQMRGHVLVWHSQTPKWFFREGYNDNGALVDPETMTARQEWYIKSVLEEVANLEKRFNKGKRLVYAWDVVNEAVSDGASKNAWLRTDSDWYRVYGDETFILNAFRFANKYAPADVELVYNDYGTYSPAKRDAICNLVDEIKATPGARIDAVGMQSHVSIDYPTIDNYEKTVQAFLSHGVDVQVTELDIANGQKKYNSGKLKKAYKDYFAMYLRNRKTEGKNGISGVTIWGIQDDGTWLNNQPEHKGNKQYPLLFNKDYTCKPAFYGVLEAAEEYKQQQ